MKRTPLFASAAMLIATLSLIAQGKGAGFCCGGGCAPIAATIELKGKVVRVQITPGGGMPSVEIKSGGQVTKVHLGSMRYLMAQGFNPKVDDDISAKAYKLNRDVAAISVTLPGQNKTIQLRDNSGCPVWRGGGR